MRGLGGQQLCFGAVYERTAARDRGILVSFCMLVELWSVGQFCILLRLRMVACSTVTVAKCQAALKSLQEFEFFKPTCLCREPSVDPECNSFRDYLFDHKCISVTKTKEEDQNAIEALPTCTQAHTNCQRSKHCVKLYEDFKTNCKTRDGRCRMENR
ncbi:hypothetical protein QAD02_006883 [Eretmocerus hayati]|uniref:Uncharacterized protein n=1 Tax=Eretmocerus hayati TaxID=131215 RepID=A0ACC2N2X9_9HYME|nr:hypothetical protein QAD02_006883 [Eretmocerus hayati]